MPAKKKVKSKRLRGENNERARVWNRTEGHCHLCSARLKWDDKWHIDHLVPRHSGGPDEDWNLLPACTFCNGIKKSAVTYKMRRVLMYGRYCLDEATRRGESEHGATIYECVEKRVKALRDKSKKRPAHVHLWKYTPRKK